MAFIGGVFAGSRRSDISGGSGNNTIASGHEAANQENRSKLAGNIDKSAVQADGIAIDNRQASLANRRLGKDIADVKRLADRLDELTNTGGN